MLRNRGGYEFDIITLDTCIQITIQHRLLENNDPRSSDQRGN